MLIQNDYRSKNAPILVKWRTFFFEIYSFAFEQFCERMFFSMRKSAVLMQPNSSGFPNEE